MTRRTKHMLVYGMLASCKYIHKTTNEFGMMTWANSGFVVVFVLKPLSVPSSRKRSSATTEIRELGWKIPPCFGVRIPYFSSDYHRGGTWLVVMLLYRRNKTKQLAHLMNRKERKCECYYCNELNGNKLYKRLEHLVSTIPSTEHETRWKSQEKSECYENTTKELWRPRQDNGLCEHAPSQRWRHTRVTAAAATEPDRPFYVTSLASTGSRLRWVCWRSRGECASGWRCRWRGRRRAIRTSCRRWCQRGAQTPPSRWCSPSLTSRRTPILQWGHNDQGQGWNAIIIIISTIIL